MGKKMKEVFIRHLLLNATIIDIYIFTRLICVNILAADTVEPGSAILTTSYSFVLSIIHRLTLKFPHSNCRIMTYEVDKNIIHSSVKQLA